MHRRDSDPAEVGTPQGAAFTASARRNRRRPAAIVLATFAFLGVAVLAKLATSDVSAPIPSAAAQASPPVATSSSAIGIATPESSRSGPPARNASATPHPTFVPVPVGAGTTRLVLAGSAPIGVTVALPHGWEQAGGAMYVGPKATASVGMSISAWIVQHVFLFPCRWTTPMFTDEQFDHTAQGQAQALSAWWGQDVDAPISSNASIAPIATRPRPATIDGHPAWYVEALVPSDFDFTMCDGGQLVFWESADGEVRYALGPGELDRLWLVDVDGTPIVIDAGSALLASTADEVALKGIIDSIVIKS